MKRTSKSISGAGWVRMARRLGLAALLGASSSVLAAGTLNNISFSAGAGGSVEITLDLSEPVTELPVFTTEDPPRIIIDLPDTRNGVAQRRIPVGIGATSSIATAEAAGRTRVSVDLFRSSSYETRTEGNRVILVVGGTSTAAAPVTAYNPDPAKRTPNVTEVANIDFRRTPQGTGRVILSLTGEGVASEMRVDGQRVRIDLAGVFLPENMAERLDVIDFATPVQSIELSRSSNGTRLELSINGRFEPLAYQTGNEFVIEVDPVQAVVVAADGTAVEVAEGAYVGRPVTFNFQDIPVRTVLQLIAEESGLNVVAADSVTGNVTLRLINVPWDQALDLVLRARSLDQRRDRNVIWIAPQAEIASYEKAVADARLEMEQRAELVSEYITINYGSAEDISKLLTDDSKGNQQGGQQGQQQLDGRGFLSPRGSVTFDRRTNTLLLNDLPHKIEEIKTLIALLDRPVDQVLIEARIVIANESFARELGSRFGVSGANQSSSGRVITTSGSQTATNAMIGRAIENRLAGRNGIGGIGQDLTGLPGSRLGVNLPVQSPAGSLGFAILGADYLLDLELSALQQEGRGEVVSSPRVITANQREANIKQGDEIGYKTITTSGGAATEQVQFKEVVLELLVTPTITQDGRVYLVLSVKKDQVNGFIDGVPQIAKREISTAVLVDDGQTVVIGGVYEFTSIEDLRKVPFLGDVPVLGNLFKNTRRESSKAELLIFVTPRVLAVAGRNAR
ncbi:MAG: type IV pilus secretin PilQ [Aquimonas sp.]|nr:type IV pilus secretin PilQ [Aquimonas sp.]